MNQLTELRHALSDQLKTIQVNGCYNTSAGNNVLTGWYNELIDDRSATFPLIVVQRGKNGPPELAHGELVLNIGYYIVGAVDAGLDDYDEALDALESDLWFALHLRGMRKAPWAPPGVASMTFGEPQHVAPGDGTKAASILIPVNFKVIIQNDQT